MGHKYTNHLPLALLIGLGIALVLFSMVLFTRTFVTASSDLEQPLTSNSISGKPNKPTPEPATVDWGNAANKPAGFADNLDNDALGELACDKRQLARWNGSAWECFSQGPTITRFHAPGENVSVHPCPDSGDPH